MRKGKTYGYIRVSSVDQNESRQRLAMQAQAIADRCIFMDKLSGKDFSASTVSGTCLRVVLMENLHLWTSFFFFGRGREKGERRSVMEFNPFETGYEIVMETNPDDTGLAKAYGKVATFLCQFPDMQASKNPEVITPEFLRNHAKGFADGRRRGPVIPKTIPDERIKDILEVAYHVPPDMLEDAIQRHMEAMGAENFIGWILESYIASEAEPLGWAWCSGAMVRSVDFIRHMAGGNWKMLQVKNRSNSENSSSSRVRVGTSIEKWFRINAYTGRTYWDVFPDPELRTKLSEDNFRKYIKGYFLQRL